MREAWKRSGVLTLVILLCLTLIPLNGIDVDAAASGEPERLIDELNDWTKIYSRSANLQFDATNSHLFDGDLSRAQRKSKTHEEIVWRYNDMSAFEMTVYYRENTPVVPMGIYLSADGINWTAASPVIAGRDTAWQKYDYSITGLSGVHYVKARWGEVEGDYAWTPQISRAVITGPDTPPPLSAPTQLNAEIGEDGIMLQWQPASVLNLNDDATVTYAVYRDHTEIAVVQDPFYTDMDVVENGSYAYYVEARDSAGHVSNMSNVVYKTYYSQLSAIPADRLPPAGWKDTKWIDPHPGVWLTIDVTKFGLPANDRSVDASKAVRDIIAETHGPRIIYFPEGSYYFQTPLTISTGDIIFRGDGLDKTLLAIDGTGDNVNAEIRFEGKFEERRIAIVASPEGGLYPVSGDRVITVEDASSLEVGDYIRLGNALARIPAASAAEEKFYVVQEKSGNTIVLDRFAESETERLKGLVLDYPESIAPYVYELDRIVPSPESGGLPVPGDDRITVADASGLEPGDLIQVGKYKGLFRYSQPTETQIVRIEAVDGNTLTLDMKLGLDYSDPAKAPVYMKINAVRNIGVERLKVQRVNPPTIENISSLMFVKVYNGFVRDTEFAMAQRGLIGLENAKDVVIERNYLHGTFVNQVSYGYGVHINYGSTGIKVTDNKLWDLRHQILLQLGANHNVVAYNSTEEHLSYNDIALHANYAYMNLFEGNKLHEGNADNSKLGSDASGTGPGNTWLRNYASNSSGGIGSLNNETARQNMLGNYAAVVSMAGSDHFAGANRVGADPNTATVEWGKWLSTAPLPKSLYLDGKPDFFSADMPWPLYGPGIDSDTLWGIGNAPPASLRDKPDSPVAEPETGQSYRVADNLNNWELSYSHTDGLTIVHDHPNEYSGDGGRVVRTSESGEEIVWNKTGITALRATVHGPDAEEQLSAFASPDGERWTLLESETSADTGDGVAVLEWTGLSGVQYVKLAWNEGTAQGAAVQLLKTEFDYSNTFTDHLDNWNYVHSHSSGLNFDIANAAKVENDGSRAKKSANNGQQEIVWRNDDISAFRLAVYYWNGINDIEIFTSGDGTEWQPAAATYTDKTNFEWTHRYYSASNLEGVRYVKVQWPEAIDDNTRPWTPQIGRLEMTGRGPAEESPAVTAPSGLTASVTDRAVTLQWQASEGPGEDVSYDVYRNGSRIGMGIADTAYKDNDVTGETTFLYYVIAKNAFGDASVRSAIVQVRTPAFGDGAGPDSNSGLGGGTVPLNPGEQHVGLQELGRHENGYAIIVLKDSIDTLVLPTDAANALNGGFLRVQGDTFKLDLPEAVLRQLSEQAKPGGGTNEAGEIRLVIRKLDDREAQEVIAELGQDGEAQWMPAGPIFDFQLAYYGADGEKTAAEPFVAPATLRLKVESSVIAAANSQLVGLYHLMDDNRLEYVDGTYEDGLLTASLQHFSLYAALVYNRSYGDLPDGHWATSAVKRMSARLLVDGVGEGLFRPERAITRAEFAVLLSRALRLVGPGSGGEIAFADVSMDEWYASAVAAVAHAGIVNGIGEGRFEPESVITREQMATMLMRAYAWKAGEPDAAVSGASPTFVDEADISPWAAEHVRSAASLGLVNGRGAGRFVPGGIATRAEAAVIVLRLLDQRDESPTGV